MGLAPHTVDVIVIGAGHNGLVAAAYLAKAGQRVLVLERRKLVGGCAVTEERWPGFQVSTAAYVNSLFRPDIVRDLDLARHGFTMLPRSPSSFTPLPDGRSLLMGPDKALTHKEVSKFSRRDADALGKRTKRCSSASRGSSNRCSTRHRRIRGRARLDISGDGFGTVSRSGRWARRAARRSRFSRDRQTRSWTGGSSRRF